MALPGVLGGLLGNPVLEQIILWQLGGSVVGAALGPYMQAITNAVQSATPLVPLSPADAAAAVVRNELTEDEAAGEAANAGVNRARFHTLVRITGDAPSPAELAEGLRRGFITPERYLEGVRQGRMRDEWADFERRLSTRDPSPAQALAALLKGQLPETEARTLYAAFGGNPDHFDWQFHTEGASPTPVELGVLAHRGIIPWDGTGPGVTSYEQGFLEGQWRNKWSGPMREATTYLPPPRTVTAMYREGSLSREQALDLLQKAGLSAELAAAYISAGSHQRTARAKELSESTVRALYHDRLVPREQAKTMLEALTYSADEAEFLLELTDLELATRYLGTAVARVHALYVGHKIDRASAQAALGHLDVPAKNVDELLGLWTLERSVNVAHLTAATYAGALKKGIIEQPEAQAGLESLGYTAYDAWLYLSEHIGAALNGRPARSEPGAVAAL